MTGMGFFFYLFASLVFLGATGAALFRNPVYAALSLVFTFLNAAGLLILLQNEFLALLLVIVYVGAVATLFLFVVMMLKIEPRKGTGRLYTLTALGAILCGFFLILSQVDFESVSPGLREEISLRSLAMVLYTKYADYLQIMGVILLLAMVGCILLVEQMRAQSKTFIRYQDMSEQAARDPRDCVVVLPKGSKEK